MNTSLLWSVISALCTVWSLRWLLPRHHRLPGTLPVAAAAAHHVPRHRRVGTDGTDWADILDAIAAEVRAGSSLTAAIEYTAATRHPQGDAAVVVHTLGVAASLGGPVTGTLRHGALVLRDRRAARAEAQAHSAQARLSATVLTVLPIAFTVVAVATSSSFRSAALSPAGLVALGIGVALNLIGRQWMRRLVDRSTQ